LTARQRRGGEPSNPSADQPALVRVELPAPVDPAATGVALVTLDRPGALNALSFGMVAELADALERLEADPACRVAVIAGGERAFAAGADIRELAVQTPRTLGEGVARGQGFHHWDRVGSISIPLIAAVRGLALGGGCELAMLCDIVVAGESAQFGQPEIRLGIIPGAGGTQRLPRAVGRAAAMDLILTGRSIPAHEALERGLVSRLVPDADVVPAGVAIGAQIAAYPRVAVAAAKRAVNAASETGLTAGLRRERQAFFALFDTAGQREGMAAFLEKRPPAWRES
jgi:enoyl-CoA hydratase